MFWKIIFFLKRKNSDKYFETKILLFKIRRFVIFIKNRETDRFVNKILLQIGEDFVNTSCIRLKISQIEYIDNLRNLT